MEDKINREITDRLLQGLEDIGQHTDMDQQYSNMSENLVDFQKYLEPNSQPYDEQNFESMNLTDLPGQQYLTIQDGTNTQDQSMQKDLFGEEELIEIDNGKNQEGIAPNSAAYQRSRPDGSPMFSQSSGFIPGDSESVVFRPIKQLDFSSLDETAMTDIILPRGVNRSASTPDNKNSKSISMISREQFIENSGMDRNDSPDGNFYELKSSPNQSEHGEELDSKVIFSPLHGLQDIRMNNFDPGMKSPPLSKMQIHRQNAQNTEHFELTQQPIDDTDLSQYDGHDGNQHLSQKLPSPQRFVQQFGQDRISPKYSPNHGQSPHHHSISPSLQHSQGIETREIFVSVPQHVQFSQSPDSLNHSGQETQNIIDNGYPKTQSQMRQQVTSSAVSSQPVSNQMSNYQKTNLAPVGQNQINMQSAVSVQPLNSKQTVQDVGHSYRGQPIPNQNIQNRDSGRQQMSTNTTTKGDNKHVEKKPWNYAKGSGNREPHSYMEKGAQKREMLAQQAKARMTREDPKGRAQNLDRNIPNPGKVKRDMRICNGQSTENINTGEVYVGSKNPRQNSQNQNRAANIPVSRGNSSQVIQCQDKFSTSKMNRGETVKSSSKDGREQHKNTEDLSPVTQVEQYSEAHDSTLDVQEMEDVRSQLKNMLKITSGESMTGGKAFDLNDATDHIQNSTDLYPGNVEYSLMSGNSQDNVSELLENFPSISACMWTDNSSINRNDVSVHNENSRLREMLEKERYRRKHCEQQIQKLNIKHLETQQQLAVAVSTDKRKDIMIEQLDKQLGKVLEGWKRQDHEKTATLEKSRLEKQKLEEKIAKQQQVIDSFEQDMSEALEAVKRERDDAESALDDLKSQIEEKERNRKHAEDMLETEREKSSLLKQEMDMVKESRDQTDKKFQQLQDRMYQEQDGWFKREQELLHKIDEVSESNVKVLQQEKDKNEELANRNKQMEEEIHEIQKIIKKMEMEHDAVQREKESLKVEIGIMEAKFESAQRTLEAELASQMEKEIADQMSELQKKVEKADSDLREKHYEHTKELNKRHKEDLEKHLANFHRQLKDKDDENRRQVQDYEEKLQEYRSEISNLQESKQKLEKQRTDILLKLQQMMQSQWNEALSLLATTPQRKRGNFNGPSKLGLDESKTSSKVDFNFRQSSTENVEGNTLQMSDLTTRDLSASQRGTDRTVDEVSTEVNLTDFQASLHMQQLLQSLSSLTTQPFPVYGGNQPSNQPEKPVYQDSTHTLPNRSEESHKQSYPSSPKQSHHYGNINSHGNASQVQAPNYSQHNIALKLPTTDYPQQSNSSQLPSSHHVQQSNVSQLPTTDYPQQSNSSQLPSSHHVQQSNVSQLPTSSYSQQVYPGDEVTDEFNAHLQMLLNVNRPTPAVSLPRDDSVNYGQNSLNQSHLSRQFHRQTSNDSVDQWLRQSVAAHDSNVPGHPHELNGSHASHVSSQQENVVGQLGMAVPIRPPQQHESFISHPDSESHPSISNQHPDASHLNVHPASSGCYSPPTKQTRKQALQDADPLLDESVRLAKDYNEITDKVEQHEYRQGELQHYIHMLLQKPPGSVTDPDENMSLFSHDQTEDLDLNDTAQAAQIQRELSRIQELREKPQGQDETARRTVKLATAQGSKAVGQSFQGVLQPEHLAEISRYLEKHKDHLSGKTEEDEHIAEIVGLLKNMQKQNYQNKQTFSPKSPRDKVKKNLRGQISKVGDSCQSRQETSQGQNNKVQGQTKKVERKVASVGPNRHIQGKGKNAWK